MYAAYFTKADATQDVVCGRPNCRIKNFPPGTPLEYLESVDPTQAGRHVCKECFVHYMNKQSTISTQGGDLSHVVICICA